MPTYKKSSLLKRCGQWSVTKYGLECNTTNYVIFKADLAPDEEYPIEQHMLEKSWVIQKDFERALAHARSIWYMWL